MFNIVSFSFVIELKESNKEQRIWNKKSSKIEIEYKIFAYSTDIKHFWKSR